MTEMAYSARAPVMVNPDPWRLKALALNITIIVGIFTLIGFLGDRFFLTRVEGEKIASKLSEIGAIVERLDQDNRNRDSALLRTMNLLDQLEKRIK